MKFNPCKLYPSLPYFVQDRAPWNWKTLESSWAAHSPVAMSLYLGIKQSKWWDGVGRSHWSMCFCRCLRRHFSIFNLMGMFLKIVDFSFVFFGAIWAKHRWMHWHNVCLKRHLDASLAKMPCVSLGERKCQSQSKKLCDSFQARSSFWGSRRRPVVHSELAHFQLWPLVPLSCRAPSHLGNFGDFFVHLLQGTRDPHSMYDLTFLIKATIRYFLSGDITVFFQHNVINVQLEYQSQGAFLVFLLIVQLKGNKTRERAAFNYNPWWSNSQTDKNFSSSSLTNGSLLSLEVINSPQWRVLADGMRHERE